jgi:hypothetical protein
VSDRIEALRRAFAEFDAGRPNEFESLFTPDAKWLGVPESGIDGATPI